MILDPQPIARQRSVFYATYCKVASVTHAHTYTETKTWSENTNVRHVVRKQTITTVPSCRGVSIATLH